MATQSGVPSPPASTPHIPTATMPAMSAVVAQPSPQGFARHVTGSAPRITVQYPQVGTTLSGQRGQYVVRSTIGSGEFGAVYECIGPFDQIYALTMVRQSNRPYSQVQT